MIFFALLLPLLAILAIDFCYRSVMGGYGWTAIPGGLMGTTLAVLLFSRLDPVVLPEVFPLLFEGLSPWAILLAIILCHALLWVLAVLLGAIAGDLAGRGLGFLLVLVCPTRVKEGIAAAESWTTTRKVIVAGTAFLCLAAIAVTYRMTWGRPQSEVLESRMKDLIDRGNELLKNDALKEMSEVEPILKEFDDLHVELKDFKSKAKNRIVQPVLESDFVSARTDLRILWFRLKNADLRDKR